jgi:peptidoglycan/LPS O-acetylase OafA/YrhL
VRRVSGIGLRAAALLVTLTVTLGITYLVETYLTRHHHVAGIERPWLRHSLAVYGDRFALGLLCAAVFIEMRRRSAFVNPGVLLSFGVAVFAIGVWVDPFHRDQYAAVGSAAMLMTLAVGERTLLGRLFAASPMRWFGRLSYGIYLWHLPLMFFGRRVGLFPGSTPWATIPCIIGLALASTALAYVSYVAVERPALGLIDRRWGRRARWTRGAGSNRMAVATVDSAVPVEGAELRNRRGSVE